MSTSLTVNNFPLNIVTSPRISKSPVILAPAVVSKNPFACKLVKYPAARSVKPILVLLISPVFVDPVEVPALTRGMVKI